MFGLCYFSWADKDIRGRCEKTSNHYKRDGCWYKLLVRAFVTSPRLVQQLGEREKVASIMIKKMEK